MSLWFIIFTKSQSCVCCLWLVCRFILNMYEYVGSTTPWFKNRNFSIDLPAFAHHSTDRRVEELKEVYNGSGEQKLSLGRTLRSWNQYLFPLLQFEAIIWVQYFLYSTFVAQFNHPISFHFTTGSKTATLLFCTSI